MYSYLTPKDGPVISGLENEEHVFAKDQPEYLPLRALISGSPERRVITRWTFTDEQRKAIAEGADVCLELLTFGRPLQPIRMAVADEGVDRSWARVCLLDLHAASDAEVEKAKAENDAKNFGTKLVQ